MNLHLGYSVYRGSLVEVPVLLHIAKDSMLSGRCLYTMHAATESCGMKNWWNHNVDIFWYIKLLNPEISDG